jgi:hypothetical protein
LQRKAEKIRRIQSEQDKDYLFKPQINPTSDVICASDPNRNIETLEEKIERLSVKDVMKKQ